MSPASLVLPIAILAGGLLIAYTAWKLAGEPGRAKWSNEALGEVLDVARRADAPLAEAVACADALHRVRVDPDLLALDVAAVIGRVDGLAGEAAALRDGPGGGPNGRAVTADLERAVRALELLEHGRRMMALASRERELEAETAVRRGHLHLVHAREALRERAARIEALSSARAVRAERG
jgi:hypothetical protein